MEVFNIDPGLMVWSLLNAVFAVVVVVGVVLSVRFFVRLNRRVDLLTRTVERLAQERAGPQDVEG
ncbi:MAG: hypothetical protein ACYC6T_02065 [Thermoleophilia bacterium]